MIPIMLALMVNDKIDNKKNLNHMAPYAFLTDLLITVTTLVVGIMGACFAISGMPEAASYALIGVGGSIILSYIGLLILSKIKSQGVRSTNNHPPSPYRGS